MCVGLIACSQSDMEAETTAMISVRVTYQELPSLHTRAGLEKN